MPDLTFNTDPGVTVARELLIAYLNTGTASTPELNLSIAGNGWDTYLEHLIRAAKAAIAEEGIDLDGSDAAQVKLWNLGIKDADAQALAAQDMLIVHFYAGTAATPFAERYASCMVEITGLGGEGGGNVGMPITVTYGGERTVGTAAKAQDGTITFTPA